MKDFCFGVQCTPRFWYEYHLNLPPGFRNKQYVNHESISLAFLGRVCSLNVHPDLVCDGFFFVCGVSAQPVVSEIPTCYCSSPRVLWSEAQEAICSTDSQYFLHGARINFLIAVLYVVRNFLCTSHPRSIWPG